MAERIDFDVLKSALGKKVSDESILKLFDIACQSIVHRQYYCIYHYNRLCHMQKNGEIHQAYFNSGIPEIVGVDTDTQTPARMRFEADTQAFLLNVHIMVDSVPYLINLFFQDKSNYSPDDRRVGWGNEWLNSMMKFLEPNYFSDLQSFQQSENFQKLKGYINCSKHKRMIRIFLPSSNEPQFEEFTYKYPVGQQKTCKNMEVFDLIYDVHDNLIPEMFKLCKKLSRP